MPVILAPLGLPTMRTLLRSSLLLLASLLACKTPARAADLEAGVAAVEITPPKGYRMAGYYAERLSTGTHDPLYAKALVFRQGGRQAALVFCDLVGVPRAVASRARERAGAATGIPVANIAVAATHSHTGPLFFGAMHTHLHEKAIAPEGRAPREEFASPAHRAARVAGVVANAHKALAPARLAGGPPTETRLAFNRRYLMK